MCYVLRSKKSYEKWHQQYLTCTWADLTDNHTQYSSFTRQWSVNGWCLWQYTHVTINIRFKCHVFLYIIYWKLWGTDIRGLMRGMATLSQCNQELLVSETKMEDPRWAWGKQVNGMWYFLFSALTLLVGQQEWHPVCKKTGCWFVGGDDLTAALHDL